MHADDANSIMPTIQTCDNLTSYACRWRRHTKFWVHWI